MIDFLKGFGIEPFRLLLLIAASMIGGMLFGGHLGSATPKVLLEMLFFYAAYALLIPIFARDLVQGWVGMFARHIPSHYTSRGENLGRGIVDLAGSLLLVVGIAFGSHTRFRGEEVLGEAFALWVVILFGLGTSIPRFYFTLSRPHRTSRPQPSTPEGRRRYLPFIRKRGADADKPRDPLDDIAVDSAVFFYLLFLGVGLGLAAAHAAAGFHHGDTLAAGTLCRHSTKTNHHCRSKRTISITADRSGPIHLVYSHDPLGDDDDPTCDLMTSGALVEQHHQRFEAHANTKYTYRVVLPPKARRCSYQLELDQPPESPASPKSEDGP